jgi:peptide/nickel transport system substrate-binding protein
VSPRPLGAALLIVAGAVSCDRTSEAPGAGGAASVPRRGGTLVIGSTTDVDAWNEYVSQQTFAINLLRRVYARLAQEQGDTRDHPPTFLPSLASSWQTSADGSTLTFALREARWSDGTPVTARDVRFTWTAQTSPEVAWTGASFKKRLKDVRVVDDRTVTFQFDGAYPEMLADAVEGGIVPEHVFAGIPFARWRTHDWSQVRAASGPFVPESWRPGEEIVLARNPHYHDPERPLVDKLAVRIVPDMGNLETQLSAGTIDYLEGLPPSDAARMDEVPGVSLVAFDNPMFDYVGWNGAKKPFDDPDVRRALTLAIDRAAIVEEVLHGYGRVSSGPLLSSWWAADPSQKPWPHDPEEARRILAAKGFDADRPLTFELTTNAGNRVREAVSLKIQEQLGRVGVRVATRSYEMKAFRERNTAGNYDAYVAGWRFGGKLDLDSIFGSGSLPPKGSNVVFYRSKEADRILHEIASAADWRSAKASYAALAVRLHADQPYTFLYEGKRIAAHRDRVRGVVIDVPADPLARLDAYWLAP